MSLYLTDAHTAAADAELRKDPEDVVLSPWVDVELKSALGLAVRRGDLPLEVAERALSRYELDRSQGRYRAHTIEHQHFVAAQEALSFTNTLRAGDALHLGVTLVEGDTLVTADKGLAEVAQARGVRVVLLP